MKPMLDNLNVTASIVMLDFFRVNNHVSMKHIMTVNNDGQWKYGKGKTIITCKGNEAGVLYFEWHQCLFV